MKNKGFSLVELLAVIVILGVILIIAIPNVSNSIEIAKKEAYIKDEEELVRATEDFIVKNIKYIPRNIGDTKEVKLSDLLNAKAISTIVNPNNNKETCNGYVLVSKIDENKYTYIPHLNCEKNIGSSLEDGLVAHYTFDDFQEPTVNLYQGPTAPGLYMIDAYDIDYGYGTTTNSQWVIDNSDQPIDGIDVQKISRINSGVTQILYVNWGGLISHSTNGVTFASGEEKTVSFYYYGTYGTQLSPYIGGHTGDLALYADNAISGNGTTQIRVPVTENKWNMVSFKIKNIGTTSATFNWGWMMLHSNNANVALDNTEYWKFTGVQVEGKSYATPFVNGTRTGVAKDYSLNNNNATLSNTNTPKWTEDAIIGEGEYKFDGRASKIDVLDNSSLNFGTNPFSISFWINYKGSTVINQLTGTIISKTIGEANVPGFFVGVATVGGNGSNYGIVVSTTNGVWGTGNIEHKGAYLPNTWYYVTIVREDNKFSIYQNGILKKSGTNTLIDDSINTSSHLLIGSGPWNYVNANIDDVRLYSRALSDTEIKHNYDIEAYKISKEGNS